jgi:hypothetical protein
MNSLLVSGRLYSILLLKTKGNRITAPQDIALDENPIKYLDDNYLVRRLQPNITTWK